MRQKMTPLSPGRGGSCQQGRPWPLIGGESVGNLGLSAFHKVCQATNLLVRDHKVVDLYKLLKCSEASDYECVAKTL
ncbi:hypothetical protein CEXT_163411 [Caerostris extrusa]|uniref:Uncharacterized protein n=1 Tax=Caerostris extrusa TaxID=172846 RepID=A0AAV4V3V0_CAEEX|nr:hypothetical protein CEXT_163411 [Caerostris extrusa]